MTDVAPSTFYLAAPGGQEIQELPREAVLEAIAQGKLLPDHWVWSPAHDDWKPAAEIPGLKFAPTVVPSVVKADAEARPVKRLIVVSGNCQMGGLSSVLQSFFPDDTILPIAIPAASKTEEEKNLRNSLAKADLWILGTDYFGAQKRWLEGKPEKPGFRVIPVPNIVFRAFHPDLCYARLVSDTKNIAPHYNSAIGIWAFNRGLTIDAAVKLFNRESYAGLGYFNLWDPSVEQLRNAFKACDLDFNRFMLAIKRRGVFMYSLNHPKAEVLVELARLISLKMGASEAIYERAIPIIDGLTHTVWPVYPEIADELSLPDGGYDWKIDGTWLQGIDKFLRRCFLHYTNQKIPRGSLVMQHRDEALYDRVLGPQVGSNG